MMHSPAHPGLLIKEDLVAQGVTATEAEKRLGVDKSQLSRLLNGHSAISAEMAIRLEAVIGGTADHYMRMQSAYDLAQARMHSVRGK